MKVKTDILKTKSGKIVATAYPHDSARNREWQRKQCEKKTGEALQWQPGADAEIIPA